MPTIQELLVQVQAQHDADLKAAQSDEADGLRQTIAQLQKNNKQLAGEIAEYVKKSASHAESITTLTAEKDAAVKELAEAKDKISKLFN
jgi:uncharacterized coiled-coil DUF342 family protein